MAFDEALATRVRPPGAASSPLDHQIRDRRDRGGDHHVVEEGESLVPLVPVVTHRAPDQGQAREPDRGTGDERP